MCSQLPIYTYLYLPRLMATKHLTLLAKIQWRNTTMSNAEHRRTLPKPHWSLISAAITLLLLMIIMTINMIAINRVIGESMYMYVPCIPTLPHNLKNLFVSFHDFTPCLEPGVCQSIGHLRCRASRTHNETIYPGVSEPNFSKHL